MMLFNRSRFESLGRWDEDFFVAYADWDIIRRIMNSGLKIYQHNKSSINHFGLSRHDPHKGMKWRKDFQTFIKKWGAEGQLDRTKK
jgi:GT2 family glycosyltransferase